MLREAFASGESMGALLAARMVLESLPASCLLAMMVGGACGGGGGTVLLDLFRSPFRLFILPSVERACSCAAVFRCCVVKMEAGMSLRWAFQSVGVDLVGDHS